MWFWHLHFHANAHVSELVNISRTLRAKDDVGDVAKTELEKLESPSKFLKEASEME